MHLKIHKTFQSSSTEKIIVRIPQAKYFQMMNIFNMKLSRSEEPIDIF